MGHSCRFREREKDRESPSRPVLPGQSPSGFHCPWVGLGRVPEWHRECRSRQVVSLPNLLIVCAVPRGVSARQTAPTNATRKGSHPLRCANQDDPLSLASTTHISLNLRNGGVCPREP